MLLCIEGCDSVGKNTQSKRLVEKFDSIGRNAVVMSFPRYETTVGKAIRRHLQGETMLTEFIKLGGRRHAPPPKTPSPSSA